MTNTGFSQVSFMVIRIKFKRIVFITKIKQVLALPDLSTPAGIRDRALMEVCGLQVSGAAKRRRLRYTAWMRTAGR